MNVITTGLDSAPLIPVGSTLIAAYWTAPHGYVNPGESYETKDKALEAAIARMTEAVEAHSHSMNASVPLPEKITLDYRWTLGAPGGGSTDLVAQRNVYASIADAEEALELYRRFTPRES